MHLTLVSGSHRPASQSLKVARFLAGRVADLALGTAFVLDLAQAKIPFWDEEHGAKGSPWLARWEPVATELRRSDGFVLVTPEWGGMATPALKNLLLYCEKGEMRHKPALIATVSSAVNGAYPVAELRATGGKNTHLCFIPEHVIVRMVKTVLNGPAPETAPDAELRSRIDYALRVLAEYARALAAVRASGVIDAERFPFGM